MPDIMGNSDTSLTAGLMGLDIGTGSALIADWRTSHSRPTLLSTGHHANTSRFVEIASGTAVERGSSPYDGHKAKCIVIYGVY
jgi:hypothetical protein